MKVVDHRKGFEWSIKCFFSILMFLLLQVSFDNASGLYLKSYPAAGPDSVKSVTVLETVNSFRGHWLCANDNFLYGVYTGNPRTIARKSEKGQAVEVRGNVTTVDPSYVEINKMFSTSTPGLLFCLVSDSLNSFYLLKSADAAATFTKVYTFGEGNGPGNTNAHFVRILRGLLELTRDVPAGGGKGTLYIGEYNIEHPRTSGGMGDRVRIMKSIDNGNTWLKVMEWNTNGSNQVGHIHAMRQDPYTGEIYICTGDDLNKAGIIKWDGTSPWSDNMTLTDLGKRNGFSVLTGGQRYRACDVLFDENSFYIFADTQKPNNPTGSESGIWKGSKSFNSYVRVNNDIYIYDPMQVGWFGDKIGDTFIFTTSREVDSQYKWNELNTQVYISPDGNNWYPSGVIDMRDYGTTTTSNYINNVYSYKNRIYIDCVGGAGHYSTIQCELSKKWKADEEPIILHPVYFVGTWNSPGNDANLGINPDAPKRTLKNILESNRISAGARVRISKGTFQESDINPDWSGAFVQGRGSVLIEGKGKDSTFIIRSGTGSNGYGIMLDSTKTMSGKKYPVTFRDLSFSNSIDGGDNHTNYVILNQNTYIKTNRCTIGSLQNDDSPLIRLDGPQAGYISEKTIHITGKQPGDFRIILESGAENQFIKASNSLFLNANDAVSCNNNGINLNIRYSTFYGIDRYGIIFKGQSGVQPKIVDNVFSCAGAPISGNSGISVKGIDYNLYNKPNLNASGGAHNILYTSEIFADPDKGDFNLRSDSPGTMRGINLDDISTDIIGRPRWNPPSMGAFESPALIVTPYKILIDSLAGSKANITLLANVIWSQKGAADWITLSSTSGIGPDILTVSSVTANESLSSRVCQVIFSGAGVLSDTLTVTQSGLNPTNNDSVITKLINVYPNPASLLVNIDYGNEKYDTYAILNSNGVLLEKGVVTLPVQQISLAGYSNGIYFIRFSGQGTKVSRIEVIRH